NPRRRSRRPAGETPQASYGTEGAGRRGYPGSWRWTAAAGTAARMTTPDRVPRTIRLRHAPGPTLGVCRRNRGAGLDFVRKREYGRLRWLEYPAETKEDRLRSMRYGGIVALP